MISRVRLRNWKSHIDSKFVFDNGVNALIGIMGSGKSSVMQGISFALYGTFPSISSRKVNLDDLIMRKPQKKEFAEVEIDFKVDGKNYSVKRRIELEKGTTLAEIREDGSLLEVNPSAVNKEVERILQMDYDLFSKAVYSEQNGLDYFLRIPKGSRIKQIDEMLKVDRFEFAREKSVLIINRVRGRREDKLRIISDMEEERLGDRIDSKIKEIKKLNEDLEQKRKKLLLETREKNKLSRDVMVFEGKEKEMNAIEKQLEGIKSGLEEIEENLKLKLEKFEGKDLKRINSDLEDIRKEIAEMTKMFQNESASLEKKRSELASLNTEIRIIAGSIKDLSSFESVCPVCESPVTQEKKQFLLEGRKKRESIFRENAVSLASEIENMSKKKEALEKGIGEKNLEKERTSSLIGEVSVVEALEKKKRIYENRKKSLENREALIKEELVDVSDLRERLQEKIAEERGLAVESSALEDKIKGKTEALNDLKRKQEVLKNYIKEAGKDKEISESLEKFIEALKNTQEQLRQAFLANVNSIMNSVWKEIYPYGDFEEIRLIIDKDYVLQLKETGRWLSVDGASGGERSLAALTLRIAFSLAFIPNLRWLILDEPTHNLDSNAIKNFTDILREKMHLFTDQLFLITHEERVSDGITGSLYKLERNKEANEATQLIS